MSRTDRNPSPKSVPRSSPTPSLWPLQLRFLTGFLLAFLLAVVALLLLKAPTLRDPHYWDALGCYVFQGRFMAAHGLDFAAYKTLGTCTRAATTTTCIASATAFTVDII